MIVYKSVDIEEEVRQALRPYMTVYCRPLPKDYALPNILVTQVGGGDANTVDTFEVVLDARASTEAEAKDALNTAVAVLRGAARDQTGHLRYVSVNTSGSWGSDPVRPDLSMCSARLSVVAHQIKTEVSTNGS